MLMLKVMSHMIWFHLTVKITRKFVGCLHRLKPTQDLVVVLRRELDLKTKRHRPDEFLLKVHANRHLLIDNVARHSLRRNAKLSEARPHGMTSCGPQLLQRTYKLSLPKEISWGKRLILSL